MRKKLNIGNLIKLIIMGGSILIVVLDYLKVILNCFKGTTLGFTWYGIIIDLTLLVIVEAIYKNLFERD